MKKYIFLLLAASSTLVQAQDCEILNSETTERLANDITFLASDRMEGRLPGTKGAEKAQEFIASRFKELRLKPAIDGNYFQDFDIPEWVKIDQEKTKLTINGTPFKYKEDFYTVNVSGNVSATGKAVYVGFGIEAKDLEYNDYKKLSAKKLKGKIFVMDVSSPDGIHPHSKYVKYHDLENRVVLAKQKGAIGVILINEGDLASDPNLKYRNIRSTGIPVVFAKKNQSVKWHKIKTASLEVMHKEQSVKASNVVAFKNNNAPYTVVIGAHYDHLGWGADNSLYTGEPAIHNGADDNASGTAGLLELARFFALDTHSTKNNYLFIAFSGEERGLLGSNYYVKHPAIDAERVNYMINMDMIGRLENKDLAVSGVGTSPSWNNALDLAFCDLNLKKSESGVGPSDHTSFYNKNIPVLHFFTGTHENYHKPSDDAELINFDGERQVLNVIVNVIQTLGGEKLDFTSTKNEESRKAPRFSVTLGIVPDYMYEDGGVRADGVTEGKPASNAGLLTGDVIIKLGEIDVKDMHSYMDALAQFKKGDKTNVVFIRGKKEMKAQLTF